MNSFFALGTAGPQLQTPDLRIEWRNKMSDRMPNRMPEKGPERMSDRCQIEYQKECQIECQRTCQNRCQKGCPIGSQNRCQIECQNRVSDRMPEFRIEYQKMYAICTSRWDVGNYDKTLSWMGDHSKWSFCLVAHLWGWNPSRGSMLSGCGYWYDLEFPQGAVHSTEAEHQHQKRRRVKNDDSFCETSSTSLNQFDEKFSFRHREAVKTVKFHSEGFIALQN